MKRTFTFLLMIAFALVMPGCAGNPTAAEDSEVVQLLADRSQLAKEYAAPLFADYMNLREISDYTIEKTAYGFYTSETPDSVYVVGFLYNVSGASGMYGYKIAVDENEICSVLEEGAEIAGFLFDAEGVK